MKHFLHSETVAALVQKIGIMLLHSLWIGVVAALLAAVIVVSTHASRPEVRYNLLTGLILLFLLVTGSAFFLSGQLWSPSSGSATAVFLNNSGVDAEYFRQTPPQQDDILGEVSGFLVGKIRIITLFWFLVVTVKFGGLLLGLYRVYQLKTQQLYSIGPDWDQRLATFARAMGITQSVRIFQSGLVKIPTVLGHFRPVILVPLGVITSIPVDQIEMVLLHELAHIRRFDFFVNFLQRLTELLFFFNPGILWISKLIRDERENCCDDMALRYSGNKSVYIQALLSFREHQLSENVYQLAFTGKGGLVQRAKRIASRSNTTLGAAEKTVLLVTLLAFFTLSVMFAQTHAPQVGVGRTSGAVIQQKPGPKRPVRKANSSIEITDKKPITKNNEKQPVVAPAKSPGSSTKPVLPDTLGPLQRSLSPIYQSTYPHATDSSGIGRQSSLLQSGYVKNYNTQLLHTYQPLQIARPFRVKPLPITEKILTEIERQGISISRGNIDFKITNEELIINGIKQPNAVHQGILDAVLNNPDDVIDFTYGSHK